VGVQLRLCVLVSGNFKSCQTVGYLNRIQQRD
jgi:hypothetical protein